MILGEKSLAGCTEELNLHQYRAWHFDPTELSRHSEFLPKKKWEVTPSPTLHSKPFPRQVCEVTWCFKPSQPVWLYQLGVLCPVNRYGYTILVFYAQSTSMVIPGWISKTEHQHMRNAGNRRQNYAPFPPSIPITHSLPFNVLLLLLYPKCLNSRNWNESWNENRFTEWHPQSSVSKYNTPGVSMDSQRTHRVTQLSIYIIHQGV